MNTLRHFVLWVDVPIEQVTYAKINLYIDYLLDKRLAPKTINCHLGSIRGFYDYLRKQQDRPLTNPVKRGSLLRLSRPLPKHLKEEDVFSLFAVINSKRDRAMFMLMLRSGLRVEEVANLTLAAIDWRRMRLYVYNGKGAKDRVVYISADTYKVLAAYVKTRLSSRIKKVFLVEKGSCKGKPISVRGIQKRMEHYAKKTRLPISCHQLRHTMATQLLNAGMRIECLQQLLGHSNLEMTLRYAKLSDTTREQEYFKAMSMIESEEFHEPDQRDRQLPPPFEAPQLLGAYR